MQHPTVGHGARHERTLRRKRRRRDRRLSRRDAIEIEDQLGEPLSMETLDGFGALSQYTLDAIVGLLSGTIPEAACACESCAPAQHG